jgi:hypothetical protein
MTELFNKKITKTELMKRIGHISQLAGAKQYKLTSGKGGGAAAIDVKNGSGLEFTILPDRGMDIAWCSFKEIPIGFISKAGVSAPGYYEESDKGFLKNFYAGLLTTCGYTYMGQACEDNGEMLGPHGYASHIPAEDVAVYQEWEGDEFVIKVRGKVTESQMFGPNIVLTREISTCMGKNSITIRDRIENCGYNRQPFMLLYHHNLGYPIVSEDTILYTSKGTITPRTEEARKGLQEYDTFQEPTHDYKEQVFYHQLESQKNDKVFACLFNKTLGSDGIGSYVAFNNKQLPYLVQWKQMGEGDYAVGLEPGTWTCDGRDVARRKGELNYIEPGEIKNFELEIGIVVGQEQLKEIQSI